MSNGLDTELWQSVAQTAKMLEDKDDPHDIPTLGTDYTVSQSGTVTEVEIKINGQIGTHYVQLLSGTVTGFSHGDRHRTHFDSEIMEQYGLRLADELEERID
jgi:hypothetical protein